MITFSLAIFETRNKDNHIFSVKDDYLAIGNGPETIENHDTKKLAGICFWQAIRNAWPCHCAENETKHSAARYDYLFMLSSSYN